MKRTLLLVALVFGASPLAAQSLWPDSLGGSTELGLEWIRPTLDSGDADLPGGRGVWSVSARIPIKGRMEIIGVLPYFVSVDGGSGNGNPYLGVLKLDAHGRPKVTFGFRPSLTSHDKYFTPNNGEIADYDHAEAASLEAISASVALYQDVVRTDKGTAVRLRVGGTYLGSSYYLGAGKILFDYGVRVSRDMALLRMGLAITGRWDVSGDPKSFQAATTQQAAFDVALRRGSIHPSLGVRVPLDAPLSDALSYALTFGITAAIQ